MFISQAWAQGAPAQGGGIESMLLIVVMFGVLYFLMIRPQMKRAKEQKKLMSELQKGDEVITSSGQVGKISKMGDQYIALEIADGVVTQVQKQSVQTLLPKGTIKSL